MVQKNFNTPFFRKKPFLLVLGLLLLVAIAIMALEVTNTTHLFHKKKVPVTIPATHVISSQQSKKAPSVASSPSGQVQTPTEAQNTKVASPSGGSSGATGQAPVQPYGTFVSNHMPGQNGSTYDEESVCDTTPGATCYIQFTNTASNVSTKLPAQLVSNDGSTIWDWNVKKANLTSGEWRITAVASLNGQTKSADDTKSLVIQ